MARLALLQRSVRGAKDCPDRTNSGRKNLMDRRSFLKTSALGGAAAAASTTLAAPAYAQGKRTLTMVTSWGRGLAVLDDARSEEHTSELQSHSEISYAVFCL